MALVLWVLGTAAILAGGGSAPLGVELPDLEGNTAAVWTAEEGPGVVMVVQARRLRNLKGWESRLRERFEGLGYARVADFPQDPGVTHEDVASKLRQRVPEGVRVFLDVDRVWARELELDTARPNLLLFDGEGRLAASFRGRYEADLFEQVCDAIDELWETP